MAGLIRQKFRGTGVRPQIFYFLEISTEFYDLLHEVIRISLFWFVFPTKAIF